MPDDPLQSSRSPRIGFLGGTFDPPHAGHRALAQLALNTLALDKVLIAPVGAQPLKRDRAAAPFEDRLAMTRLTMAGDPRLELTSIDAPRADGEPNYMIDTLHQLRATLPPQAKIYAILGADAFLTISKWHRAAELLVECPFVVGARPGFDLSRIAQALPAAISVASEDNHGAPCLTLGLRDAQHHSSRLYLLTDLQKDISATDIRAELRQGAFATGVLTPAVVSYIRDRRLYDAPPAR
jgi:nicotinate-nucleotide adenylyltransferase